MNGKALIIMLLLFAGTLPSFSQSTKSHWEIEAGTCVMNTDHLGGYSSGDINTNKNGIVYPTIMLSTGYVIPNRNIGFFFSSFSTYAERVLNGGPSPLTEKEFSIHLMPEFRYYYYSESTLRVYASVGAGVRYLRYYEIFRGDTVTNGYFSPSYQISPLCFSVGTKLSFIMDVGFGRPYMPFAFKLSYRFL